MNEVAAQNFQSQSAATLNNVTMQVVNMSTEPVNILSESTSSPVSLVSNATNLTSDVPIRTSFFGEKFFM